MPHLERTKGRIYSGRVRAGKNSADIKYACWKEPLTPCGTLYSAAHLNRLHTRRALKARQVRQLLFDHLGQLEASLLTASQLARAIEAMSTLQQTVDRLDGSVK